MDKNEEKNLGANESEQLGKANSKKFTREKWLGVVVA